MGTHAAGHGRPAARPERAGKTLGHDAPRPCGGRVATPSVPCQGGVWAGEVRGEMSADEGRWAPSGAGLAYKLLRKYNLRGKEAPASSSERLRRTCYGHNACQAAAGSAGGDGGGAFPPPRHRVAQGNGLPVVHGRCGKPPRVPGGYWTGALGRTVALAHLEENHTHWFAALKAITGAWPAPESAAGDIPKMAEAWLRWAKDNGYRW